MKMYIKEFAALTGVSVRTLHYYDEIGLLKPSFVDEHNGYRFYDSNALERMQQILFYRELDFPLKCIAKILSSPKYDKQKALNQQKHLLILKKERLERIINAIEHAEEGEYTMNFKMFDNSEFEAAREKYGHEAKKRWGSTDVFQEYEEKTEAYSKKKWQEIHLGMDKIILEFAGLCRKGIQETDASVFTVVKKLQEFITNNQYTCTDSILLNLGQMYVDDVRFQQYINQYGAGTAEFMSRAIKLYCGTEKES